MYNVKECAWFSNADYNGHFSFSDEESKFEVFQELYLGGEFVHDGTAPYMPDSKWHGRATFTTGGVKHIVYHDEAHDRFSLMIELSNGR